MFTHPLVIRAYAFRSVGLWAGLRGMTAMFLAVNDLPPFPRSPAAMLFFVLVTTAICFADVWVRRERVLIGNLGMSLWTLAGISALPPILAEACFMAGVGLFS